MGDIPSALLTESQRKYVMESDKQAKKYMMKSRIRKRVFAGLDVDGKILSEIDPDLRHDIFSEWKNKNYEPNSCDVRIRKPDAWLSDEGEKSQFQFGIQGLFEFIYLGLEESNAGDFWEILEDAIDQAVRDRGKYVKHFEPNIEFGNLATQEDTYRMWQAGDIDLVELTLQEIFALYESGHMDLDDLTDEQLNKLDGALSGLRSLQEKVEKLEPEDVERARQNDTGSR